MDRAFLMKAFPPDVKGPMEPAGRVKLVPEEAFADIATTESHTHTRATGRGSAWGGLVVNLTHRYLPQ